MMTLTLICSIIAWFKVSLCLTIILRFCIGKINFMAVRWLLIFLLPLTLFLIVIAVPMCMYLAKKDYPELEFDSWRKGYAITFSIIFNEMFFYNWD